MTALIERLITIKDGLSNRADRDAISDACNTLVAADTALDWIIVNPFAHPDNMVAVAKEAIAKATGAA